MCALLGACSDSSHVPSLFEATRGDATDGIDVRVRLDAIDRGPFRLQFGDRDVVPTHVVRAPLANGVLLRGSVDGGGSIVLARVGHTVTGVIRDGRAVYEIVPSHGGHRLVPRSWQIARPLHGPGWDELAAHRGPRPPALPASTAPIVVDVAFAYTKRVVDKRTFDGIRGLATTAIAELNEASEAAGLDVRFRIAGLGQTTSSEGGRDMRQLYYDLLHRTDFDDAHALRKQLHADILVLLVDNEKGPLGLATIMGEKDTAVAVVDQRDSVWYLTIAHEIGHIMGGLHDPADDATEVPFPYGHGFIGPTSRTIMATPCGDPETCPLVVRWSAPPDLGNDAQCDNARVLRETAATVAGFGEQL